MWTYFHTIIQSGRNGDAKAGRYMRGVDHVCCNRLSICISDQEANLHNDRWADADGLILNPNIPLSVFLAPPDLPQIHDVGNKDWNGFNAGVFFTRDHSWTVSMLTFTMSYPICHRDIRLTFAEQEAMQPTSAHGGSFLLLPSRVPLPRLLVCDMSVFMIVIDTSD
jgi:hypothetical protein